MLATPGAAEQELRLVEAEPELGPPEELRWPTWWGQRTWRPWWDWAQDRVRRSRAQASPACLERRDDERHCGPHVPDDELRGHPQDPIPEPPQHRIAAAVSGPPPLVAAPVHLHDEPRSGSAEVRDVPQDGHLPPEHDAEPAAAELRPERSLRRRERETHAASPGGNERGVLGMKGTGHDDLPSPAEERGNAPQGAGSVTRARRGPRPMSARGTERAPASRCPATARGEGVHWTRPAPKVAAPYIAPGPYPSFSYDALDPFCLPLWGPPPARSLAGGEASTELGRVPPERSEASTGGVHIRGPPRGAARTGKEEDTEVGLTYFGKRFLNAQLGRWVSADPLGVHAPGGADLNLYAYVKGLLLKAVDPVGLEPFSVASYMSGGAVEEGIDSVDALAGHEDAVQWAPASSAAAQDAAIEPATPVPPRAERDVAAAKGVVNGAVQFVAEGAASTAAALEYATAGTAKLLAPEAPWPSTILSMGGEALQLDVGENPHLQDAANEQTFGVKVFLGMASVAAGVRSGGSVTSGAARQPAGRTGPATAVPGESVAAVGVPAPGSLTNEATRHWYHAQLDAIPSRIDPSLPLRDRALQAFTMRNEIKLQARSLMADRAAADSLPAPSTLQDVVRRAYNQGLRGDDVWRYVLGGSQRSNAGVDAALGISR